MSTFTLTIELGNEAMRTADDVAAALQATAQMLAQGWVDGRIRDGNGNTVGRFALNLPPADDPED